MQRVVRWKALTHEGLEKLKLQVNSERVVVKSELEWREEEAKEQVLNYEIICDNEWKVRKISIEKAGSENKVAILSDGNGNWTNSSGEALPKLSGCIDIDFQATPFTNTLPIRRLRLMIGQKATVRVAYISFPELNIYPVEQNYTHFAHNRWLFEQPSDNFIVEIAVDVDGLVEDYPGLFRRVYP